MGNVEYALQMKNMMKLINSVSKCVLLMKSSMARDVCAKIHSI